MASVTKGRILFMGNQDNNSQNKIAKESIFIALMILMEKKNLSEISITEITNKAGVSRMAYYRNYKLKEDIIINYLDDLFQEYVNEILSHEKPDKFRDACLYFAYFRKHEKLIINLIKSNLTHLILDRFDRYLYFLFQNIVSDKAYSLEVEKYVIEYMSGGLYKILIAWVKSGMKESDEYMAKLICDITI
jgi:AcrR family transcriptional regulator